MPIPSDLQSNKPRPTTEDHQRVTTAIADQQSRAQSGPFDPYAAGPVDSSSLVERFPYLRWYMGIPELKGLLDAAYDGGWGESEFQANLWDTNWWKNRSESARKWDEAIGRDPAQVGRRRDARRVYLDQQAKQLGYRLSREELDDLVEQSLRWDFTTEEMQRALGAVDAPLTDGQITDWADTIKAESRAYLLDYDDDTARDMARRVASGDLTLEGVRSQLKRLAKANYSMFADDIDDGFTIAEATFGLRNAVAKTLEVSADDVDFRDEKYAELLSYQDEKGKARKISIAEANRWARQQDDYFKTEGAQQAAERVVYNMGRTMGLS